MDDALGPNAERYDLVIRGGEVVDGSPDAKPRRADVALRGARIAKVGEVADRGLKEIDARGKLVTPGFVDIHTHFDGQVTWEHRLIPATLHGVTTVVMGNCGVGFAPVKPHQREVLVKVMEGVEEIPEVVLTAGVPWKWESFADYLNFVESRSFDADCLFFVPHAPIRVFVMGDRALHTEKASDEDMRQMQALVAEGLRKGGVGVSTSRTLMHRDSTGVPAPHVRSDRAELLALARGLKEGGGGVFQIVPNIHDLMMNKEGELTDEILNAAADSEMDLLREISEVSGCPVFYSLTDITAVPSLWKKLLDRSDALNRRGIPVKAQIAARGLGLLSGLELSVHPFSEHPAYLAIEHLPFEERLKELRKPAVKAQILSETPQGQAKTTHQMLVHRSLRSYRLGSPPNYEPRRENSVEAEAERRGVSIWEAAYDWLTAGDGKEIFFTPSANRDLNVVHQMITRPDTLLGLGDGGAHYGHLCDASMPTFLISYWTRDRDGPRLGLGQAISYITQRNALAVGLTDRGLIAEGMKADINILDYDKLYLCQPEVTFDLPEQGRRVIQKSTGIVATILNGKVTYRNGDFTGAMPGSLVRSVKVDSATTELASPHARPPEMDQTAFRAELASLGYDDVIEGTYFPGPAGVAMHTHDWDVRGLVLGGSLSLTRNGRTDTYRPGQIYEILAGQHHGGETVPPEGLLFLSGRRWHKAKAST